MAGAPQSDLERFKAQQNAVADASLESTRNMVRLVEESQSAGVNTITMLEQQGEQLNRIEGGLDNINAEMKVKMPPLLLCQCLCSGGRKTFNGYGEMVRALCDALVQKEKD